MQTLKEEAIHCLQSLPDNVDYEEMMYRLYVLEKIEKGRQDVKNGRVMTLDEARKKALKW